MTDSDALAGHVEHFQRRVLQDAMTDATAAYWRRRADTFEWARPRPGDHLGTAGATGARTIDARLVEARDACYARAAVSLVQEAA